MSTLRYYEREHLLQPAARTEGNYRRYAPEALTRIRFIRIAQAAGFSLDDIRSLLDIQRGAVQPCKEVEALIEHRLADVRAKLSDLKEIDRHLKSLLGVCRSSTEDDRCEVIRTLSDRSSRPD